MNRRKYNLSPDAIDKLMGRLTSIQQGNQENIDYLSSQLSSSFVRKLIKVDNVEEIIDKNEQLTKHFKGLLDMYGFETMYDMYMYSLSVDSLNKNIRKSKDYSKLVPVKRKIVRGGREQEVTVWVKPDGDEEVDNTEESSGDKVRGRGSNTKKRKHARELSYDGVKGSEDYGLDQLSKLKNLVNKFPSGNRDFQEDSTYFLELLDDNGEIVGVIGYIEDGKYLEMSFYRANGKVTGVAVVGFFELLKLGAERGKGVKVEDVEVARQIFINSGLEQHEEGYWSISAKDLGNLLDFNQDIKIQGEDTEKDE